MLKLFKKKPKVFINDVNGLTYQPPIESIPGSFVGVFAQCNNPTRMRIERRCMYTKTLMEVREECELLVVDGKQVVVSMPAATKVFRLSWRLRLFRWFANGGTRPYKTEAECDTKTPSSAPAK